jgi:hypothetical protein
MRPVIQESIKLGGAECKCCQKMHERYQKESEDGWDRLFKKIEENLKQARLDYQKIRKETLK